MFRCQSACSGIDNNSDIMLLICPLIMWVITTWHNSFVMFLDMLLVTAKWRTTNA